MARAGWQDTCSSERAPAVHPSFSASCCSCSAVFFSGSVETLLRLFPPSILGVILFLTGAQLALGSCDISKDKGERFVTVVTAALAVWNVGIAFVVGMAAYALLKRGLLRI